MDGYYLLNFDGTGYFNSKKLFSDAWKGENTISNTCKTSYKKTINPGNLAIMRVDKKYA